MSRWYTAAGAASGFMAVGAGAFGAHALRASLSLEMLQAFETGARYQMYHALALLLTGVLARDAASRLTEWAGRLFVLGTILFSGSLYTLALTGLSGFAVVTPLGGLAFLAGWLCLAAAAVRRG